MSQKVSFTDPDLLSNPLYLSASIADEQNELPEVTQGLSVSAKGIILEDLLKQTWFSGQFLQLISDDPISPGTSWSININFSDKAGNLNVSFFF